MQQLFPILPRYLGSSFRLDSTLPSTCGLRFTQVYSTILVGSLV